MKTLLNKRGVFFSFLLSLSFPAAASQAPIQVETISEDRVSVPLVTEEPSEMILSEETEAPRSMGEIQYQMQLLQQEMMALRGLVEQLSYDVQRHRGIQDDRYLELDRRLQNLSAQPQVATEVGQAVETPIATEGETGADELSEQALYDAGLASIKGRQFDEAINQLKQLIERYP